VPDPILYLVKGARSGWLLAWESEGEGREGEFSRDLPKGFATIEEIVETMNRALAGKDKALFFSTFLPDYIRRQGKDLKDLFEDDVPYDFSVKLLNIREKEDRAVADMMSVAGGEEEEGGYFLLLKRWGGGWLVASTPDMDRDHSREFVEAWLNGRAPRER
jgi:hypothetical protein